MKDASLIFSKFHRTIFHKYATLPQRFILSYTATWILKYSTRPGVDSSRRLSASEAKNGKLEEAREGQSRTLHGGVYQILHLPPPGAGALPRDGHKANNLIHNL